jgi:hypothetical protein
MKHFERTKNRLISHRLDAYFKFRMEQDEGMKGPKRLKTKYHSSFESAKV